MQNKILLYVVILLSVVLGCIRSFKKETSFFIQDSEIKISPFEEKKSILIAVKDVASEEVESIDIEEYLIGVVAGEMPASFNFEALKAQAVAARTYAYYKKSHSSGNYDVTNDSSTQVHLTMGQMRNKWQDSFDYYYDIVKKAVEQTSGEVISYNGEIIPAYYFSMSNGYTEDANVAFGEDRSYLVSVKSPEDKEKYEYEITIPINEFCDILDINCTNISFSNIERTGTNRIVSLNINNKKYTGKEVKYLLNLRSTDFDITTNDDEVSIVTRGFGHGVGMSQYGANNMANMGYDYKQIIAYYYQGTKITNLTSII